MGEVVTRIPAVDALRSDPIRSILVARSFLFMRDRALGSTVSVVLLVIAVAVVVASALLARRWQPHR